MNFKVHHSEKDNSQMSTCTMVYFIELKHGKMSQYIFWNIYVSIFIHIYTIMTKYF